MQLLPTRRLALVAVLVAAGMLLYPGGPVDVWAAAAVVTVALALIGLLDAWIGTSPKVLLLRREHPPVVIVGREATLTWEVRSESSRSLRVGLADDLAPSLRAKVRRCSVRSAQGLGVGHHYVPAPATWPLPPGPPDGAHRRPARPGESAAAGPHLHHAPGAPTFPFEGGRGAEDPSRPHPGGRHAVGPWPWRGHRVRTAARVRTRRRVPSHRLDRDRSDRPHDRAHLPRRAEPERAGAAGQRPDDGGQGRRGAPGRALDGRSHDAHHRRDPTG